MSDKHGLNAKQRYDYDNPPVSFRLPREAKQRLINLAKLNRMSLSDFVVKLISKPQPNVDDVFEKGYAKGHTEGQKKGHDEGFQEGYSKGYREAFDDTMNVIEENEIPVLCQNCGYNGSININRHNLGISLDENMLST